MLMVSLSSNFQETLASSFDEAAEGFIPTLAGAGHYSPLVSTIALTQSTNRRAVSS